MPAFRAYRDASLARLGFARGFVDVYLGPDSLILTGDSGERTDIPFDAIDRVRFGYDTLRTGGRRYEMRVWTHRAPRPLFFLHMVRDTTPGYEAVARGLAAAVAERRGIGAVECGLGWPWALFYGGFAIWITLYCGWAMVRSLEEGEPAWVALLFPAIAAVLGGLFGYGYVRLWGPRRLRGPEELDPFVGKERRSGLF